MGIDKVSSVPYASNFSPVDDAPHFVTGSANVLSTLNGWLTKRPGFSATIETFLSSIPGTIRRLYAWKRWAGSVTNPGAFYWMASTILPSGKAAVYKLKIGDASFSLIWTETTTTGIPFDFQFSNNFVFFGNASTRADMRKYDGTTCSLWGVDAPVSAPQFALVSSTLPNGLSFNTMTGVLSGTPTASNTSSITVTVTDASGTAASQTLNLAIDPAGLEWSTKAGALPIAVAGSSYTTTLAAQSGTTPYTFSIFSGSLPAGLSLSSTGVISGTPTTAAAVPSSFAIKVTDAASATAIRSFSLFVGSAALSVSPSSLPDATVGTAYSQTITASGGTSPYVYAVVGGTLPAGLSLSTGGVISGTPTTAGNFNLILRVTDSATGTANVSEFTLPINVNATVLTVTTTSLPNPQVGVPYSQTISTSGGTSPFTFSYTSGSLSAQTGYVGGYTYTSIYGHESAMSPLSDNTSLFTDQDIEWDVLASSDPQVNGINIYRSTDGGDEDPAAMRLVASLSNTTQSYIDSTEDVFLGLQTGPAQYVNDPPQPIRGLIWSNGRIWGFNAATTWFTGNEEVTNGSPIECMSDAKNGNFYQWPSEVGGITSTPNGVDIGLSEEFWQISGDTLDTFRKNQLLTGGGCLSPTNIITVGSTVYWIDTGKQIWSSDKGEIGEAIRPDLSSIDPLQTFICYHKRQTRNWLCILDGANGKLLIYDLDLNLWQIPWPLASAPTCLASGQTSMTNIALLTAFSSGHIRQLTDGTYNDDGTTYADEIRSGLLSVVPGSRTSARNASAVRQVEQFEMEMDAIDGQPNLPDGFFAIADDDPLTVPLDQWADINEPQPLQFGAQAMDGTSGPQPQNLAARRWMANQAPYRVGDGWQKNGLQECRRAAFAATWNAREQGWKVYSFDLATRTT